MRLSRVERTAILGSIQSRDSGSLVYLYGSRVNAALSGGDIDLLVISTHITFSDKISILSEIKVELGEQRIDLTLRTPDTAMTDAFVQDILTGALLLSD